MSWFILLVAIMLEVSGTTCMKYSEGMTKFVPTGLMFVLYAMSLGALALALKRIDLSVAYAIWAGLGTALIATIGVIWFKEPASIAKAVWIGMIIVGVVGLNLAGAH